MAKPKPKKEVINDTELLEKLDAVQRTTAILDCDLAEIIGASPSYLSAIRRRVRVSSHMRPRIKYVIKTLTLYQKPSAVPIFRKHLAESTQQFKKRRKKLVTCFKEAYMSILEAIDKKG